MDRILEYIEKYARARTQTMVTLVTFAGGYLLYLVYDMIRSFLDGSGEGAVLLYLFVVLFVVCGVLLCGGGLYALWKGWYKENTCSEESDEEGSVLEETAESVDDDD